MFKLNLQNIDRIRFSRKLIRSGSEKTKLVDFELLRRSQRHCGPS